MTFSKHNIFSRIADSEEYFIVNPLTGNADILTKEEAAGIIEQRYSDPDEYIAKGYLCDEAAETTLFRKRYADFLDERDKDEIQIFFVPWYTCNFSCSYCYQEGYANAHSMPDDAVVDAFFSYLQTNFAGRRKYITVFGGEPLLPGEAYKKIIRHGLEKAKLAGLETAFVTNGYTLHDYVEILKEYRIREVQVTLDGTEAIHNPRRPLKGGGSTFHQIVIGIDRALEAGITINLRVVVDRENIAGLADLARFAIEKGWTNHPLFKTQLGRNYELHYCQADQHKLFTRVEMYQQLYHLIKEHPEILEFHKPAFSISKFLFENGKLPDPLFDSCPGTKTEWAFDYTGSIYSCTATVGKKEEALGTYFPEVTHKAAAIEQWEERDVTTIKECTTCNLRLACGGGCASVAFNNTGRVGSPDCRPVKELLELGLATYF
ncbi:MAG TPA: radical SAM protein [Bacteroidota bacterium]|nr:radical SAM protein [Bacteroidota bacterium]